MTEAPATQADRPHRVVVVGGGFGGLYAARELSRDKRVALTLVDRRNFHLFQPLLYQVATGALAAGEIATPLRSIFRKRRNTTVLLGEAADVDPGDRCVVLSDGARIEYDSLIVATGARFDYFGHDDWAPDAPGLKTVEDATEIRRRILIAFEAAEREDDQERRGAWMTFVVVGGGPTGVELAGALAEISHDTLRRDFRAIDPPQARIVLVEALDRILPTYPPAQSASAQRQLERLGAVVRTRTKVVHVDDACVRVEHDGGEERIPTRTTLWAAGVLTSAFSRAVAEATGAETDRAGRVRVEPDLTIPSHPEIFVVGDGAVTPWRPDRPVPGVAQGGIQGGRYAALTIRRRLAGLATPPFRYSNRGDVAVIGRSAGVTDIPWLGPLGRRGGFLAWALWLGIHIAYLIGFANRLVVLVRWSWSFFTHGRGSRLITGAPLLPTLAEPGTAGAGEPGTPGTAGAGERGTAGEASGAADREARRAASGGSRPDRLE
jgi:NADH dehydrogenase